MSRIVCVLFVFLFGFVLIERTVSSNVDGSDPINEIHKVRVAVYYEALCPDSKQFILNQLLPSYYAAPSLIDFQLIPYGKATTIRNWDGSIGFNCQHGPIECEANIYHACTIEIVSDKKVKLDMVACMIQDNYRPKETMIGCAINNRLNYAAIIECFENFLGAQLLEGHGETTASLQPPVSYIPTITLDGSQDRQAFILNDLHGEVCKTIAHGSIPATCLNPVFPAYNKNMFL